jgi:hypothetical protein
MSERTRNGKSFAQDVLGIAFCLVGGFFAVSIVLFMRDQRPKPGLISALTAPVVELAALLGSPAALFFSAGLAALGTLLFLRTSPVAAPRPLLALLAGSLGVALIFGAFGEGGELGGWLPGLVTGFVGRLLVLVVGVALAWLGWTLLAGERGSRGSSSGELVTRVGLGPRLEASAGVSPAEAALLISEVKAPRPAPRREPVVPVRDETIRPYTPPEKPAGAPRATSLAMPSKPARPAAEPLQPEASSKAAPTQSVQEPVPAASEPLVSVLAPPAPSWEGVPEDVQEEEEQAALRLSEALSAEFETEEASPSAVEVEDEEQEQEGPGADEAAPAPPRASWEQIGLFDEELEEEAPPVKPARVELTSPFDFEAAEPKKPAHEPEPSVAEASTLTAAPQVLPGAAEIGVGDDDEGEEQGDQEDEELGVARAELDPAEQVRNERPASAPATPAKQEPRPEPSVALDAGEGWSKLVYDAGCVILEQKRVAVSMLERTFGIDFDQACRVLDELQQAGLIGPYMGGRTRDILLTREQWLPHAPHAS